MQLGNAWSVFDHNSNLNWRQFNFLRFNRNYLRFKKVFSINTVLKEMMSDVMSQWFITSLRLIECFISKSFDVIKKTNKEVVDVAQIFTC